jgi:hypothetical protein
MSTSGIKWLTRLVRRRRAGSKFDLHALRPSRGLAQAQHIAKEKSALNHPQARGGDLVHLIYAVDDLD